MTGSRDFSLRALNDVRPLYILPMDPLADEVLIPGFREASSVDCMVGFFSSAVLASLAPGLATYIARTASSFRLIVSPVLRTEDQVAIEEGLRSPGEVAESLLFDLTITEDLLQRHTLKCLSWLLRTARITIKVALMKDALFHPKVWLFSDAGDALVAHGSSNVTIAGIHKNFEQIAVSRSWQDANQRYITDKLRYEFDRLWGNKDDHCLVVDLPEATRRGLLQQYDAGSPPTEDDLRSLYARATSVREEPAGLQRAPMPRPNFRIPGSLDYQHGPFDHQGKAVTAWCDADFRGVLEMATGSGKTIASMIGAYRLYERYRPLLIVIAAPYVPLIEQWCDEVASFGLVPVNITRAGSAAKRAGELNKLRRRLRTGLSEVEIAVVSHDTLCTPDFLEAIQAFEATRLLIADEVHNLGRASFISSPPEFFEYRLGLSATPERQYDEPGTDALFTFFGPVVFRFTLEEAIGRCLVAYDYYVHPVHLTETEMNKWLDLTGAIKRNAWRSEAGTPDEYLAKLLRDRRSVLEGASEKLVMLRALLDAEDSSALRYTLIYASDKGPQQLKDVNALLHKKHILFHQLTADETANRDHTRQIIQSFQDGEIQVLTAKRVLDEGVNIPQICKAYILASTTVERQWVQRRGRLLRTCSAIHKTHSVIHDLVALPPSTGGTIDLDARSLVRSELRRAREFARLARNAGRPDGPLRTLDAMADAAYL